MSTVAVGAGECRAVFRKLFPYGCYLPLLAPPTFPPSFPDIPEAWQEGL